MLEFRPVVPNGVYRTGISGIDAKPLFVLCLRLFEHIIMALFRIGSEMTGRRFMTKRATNAPLIDIKLSPHIPGDLWSACSHSHLFRIPRRRRLL